MKKYRFLNRLKGLGTRLIAKGDGELLSMQLKNGEYLTIGEDIVVQVFQMGASFRVAVEAPRELSIVRGEIREKEGRRPACIKMQDRKPKSPSRQKRDRERDFKRSAQAD